MRYCLSKLFFLIAMPFWVNCFADCNYPEEETRFILCPKTYVTPDQIAFYENGIFVQINGFILQTESISTDAQGMFFANSRANGCGPNMWKCKRPRPEYRGMICNTCNWDWNSRCYNCGEEKSKKYNE